MKPILSKASLVIAGHLIGLAILFMGPLTVSTHGQVVATWTDSSGNWSNSANWSTLTVPNNGGGKTYDVVINGTGADTVTFDATGTTTINSLTLGFGETFQDTGSSPNLTAGFITNNFGTINWGNGSLTIGGLSNNVGGIANIHNTNVTIGSFDTDIGGVLMLTGCIGSIGPGTSGSIGGGLVIDHSNLTVGAWSFPDSGTVSITSSTVILGGVENGDRSTTFIGGSSVIMGGVGNGYFGSLTIDGSSVITGGLFNGAFNSSIGINNSTVTVNGDVANNGLFGAGGSLTVSGDFDNNNSEAGAPAAIGGAFIVAGTLNNADGAVFFIDGTSSIHAVQNDGIMRAGGLLIVNGGGFSNQMNGSLTLSGVTNVMGGFTNSGGSVILNPSATLVSDSYAQSGGSTDVSGILSTASYKQSGGETIIESGGTISATTFKATGGTVTVNGTLDPTAVEMGSGATLQGTGKIVGNVAMGGTMIPGGPGVPGIVTIFGNYEQTGNGILREFISSSSNGLLSVSGDVALDSDSILSIPLLGGFNPLGDTFTIMDYASLVGQFSNGSSFWDDGFLWDVNYGANQIDISAVRSPEPSSLLLLCIGVAVLALIAQRRTAKTYLLA